MSNITSPGNLTGFVDLLRYADSRAGFQGSSIIGIGLLIMVGFIIMFSLGKQSSKTAFSISGFVVFIMAIFMRYLNIINDGVLMITVSLFLVSLVFLKIDKSSKEGV